MEDDLLEFIDSYKEELIDLSSNIEKSLIELEQNPDNNQIIHNMFRAIHTIKGTSSMIGIEPVMNVSHSVETVFDKIRSNTLKINMTMIDHVLKYCDVIKEVAKNPLNINKILLEKMEQISFFCKNISMPPTEAVIEKKSEIIVAPDSALKKPALPQTVPSPLKATSVTNKPEPIPKKIDEVCEQRIDKQKPEIAKNKSANISETPEKFSSIRVPSEKLDIFVDLVSEIITIQAKLTQTAEKRNDSEVRLIAEKVERIVYDLRDQTMNIRMVALSSLFNKFKRLIRDLSQQVNKKVELLIKGEETELDKTIIEQLNDPLLHLIRNSVDHGIEGSEDRIKFNKPENGKVYLTATQSGSDVIIRISDDGKGLNPELIRAKAIEKKMIQPGSQLSKQDLYALLFAPGFSTAAAITNLSGRGVGLDVVKRKIELMRGSVEVDSTLGEGTTFILKIPLTLAIIDGLLVSVGKQYFILPLHLIEECVEMNYENIQKKTKNKIIKVRSEIIPFVDLKNLLQLDYDEVNIKQVIVANIDGEKIGFVVDKIHGKYQTVIKNLGKIFRTIKEVSGATILGDGSVALILDIPSLYKYSVTEKY